MKVYNTKQLNEHLNSKGISKLYGDGNKFLKSDYFQVVNGYKTLFVSGVESIDDILMNITNNIDIDRYKKAFSISKVKDNEELKNRIIERICEKYDIDDSKPVDMIKKINYVHHIYNPNCSYNDFLRMYDFEHELRCLLLKYTLKIENNLKRVFIKSLNDYKDMKDIFLTDIDSFNTSLKSHNDSIQTLKSVLDLHNSNHSKPIERKVQQDIIVPYWILINEMTFGVVINCIKNLKSDFSNIIYENLISEFTEVNLSFSNHSDKYNIDNFKKILDFVGSFRNILAHNQPIFTYNIRDDSLRNFPVFTYSQPQINRINYEKVMSRYKITKNDAILRCQHSKNNHMKETCEVLFGKDSFNMDKNPSNINLSYMIYFIYKINKVLDRSCDMKQELLNVFYDYNIVEHTDKYHIIEMNDINQLIKKISSIELQIDYKTIVESVRTSTNLRDIQAKISILKSDIKESQKLALCVKKEKVERAYSLPFAFDFEYQKYTGISANFLKKL